MQKNRGITPVIIFLVVTAFAGLAMVGGLLFESPGDQQAAELHRDIEALGIEGALVGVTGLAKAHPLVRQTAAGYRLARLAA
jgi:hypothetical protein